MSGLERQPDHELRAASRNLNDFYPTAQCVNPAADQRETETHATGPGAGWLGREKRLENSLSNFLGDAWSVVFDPQLEDAILPCRGDPNRSPLWGCLYRVLHQIVERLAEQGIGKLNDLGCPLQVHPDGYPRVAVDLAEQRHSVANQVRYGCLSSAVVVRAVGLIELAGYPGYPADLPLDGADVTVMRVILGDRILDEQEGILNAGQRIIDLVRYARREPAHGRKRLDLAQLVFRLLAGRNVPALGEELYHPPFRIRDRGQREIDDGVASRSGVQLHLLPHCLPFARLGECGTQGFAAGRTVQPDLSIPERHTA